jgi:hypothetical protein
LRFNRTTKAVTAGFALLLMLILNAAAVSPSLHECFHADNHHDDSSCVICALAAGQLCGAETVTVAIVTCLVLVCAVLRPETPFISLFDFYFSPDRAPPRA